MGKVADQCLKRSLLYGLITFKATCIHFFGGREPTLNDCTVLAI